jgi:hypothetical protein
MSKYYEWPFLTPEKKNLAKNIALELKKKGITDVLFDVGILTKRNDVNDTLVLVDGEFLYNLLEEFKLIKIQSHFTDHNHNLQHIKKLFDAEKIKESSFVIIADEEKNEILRAESDDKNFYYFWKLAFDKIKNGASSVKILILDAEPKKTAKVEYILMALNAFAGAVKANESLVKDVLQGNYNPIIQFSDASHEAIISQSLRNSLTKDANNILKIALTKIALEAYKEFSEELYASDLLSFLESYDTKEGDVARLPFEIFRENFLKKISIFSNNRTTELLEDIHYSGFTKEKAEDLLNALQGFPLIVPKKAILFGENLNTESYTEEFFPNIRSSQAIVGEEVVEGFSGKIGKFLNMSLDSNGSITVGQFLGIKEDDASNVYDLTDKLISKITELCSAYKKSVEDLYAARGEGGLRKRFFRLFGKSHTAEKKDITKNAANFYEAAKHTIQMFDCIRSEINGINRESVLVDYVDKVTDHDNSLARSIIQGCQAILKLEFNLEKYPNDIIFYMDALKNILLVREIETFANTHEEITEIKDGIKNWVRVLNEKGDLLERNGLQNEFEGIKVIISDVDNATKSPKRAWMNDAKIVPLKVSSNVVDTTSPNRAPQNSTATKLLSRTSESTI